MKNTYKKHIFLTSFLMALVVFSFGILLNYGLDFTRANEIVNTITLYETNTQAYVLEQEFMEQLLTNFDHYQVGRVRAEKFCALFPQKQRSR